MLAKVLSREGNPSPFVGGKYRKWISFATGAIWMLIAGSLYAYSSLSADLQGFGYRDISLIGSCANVGSYVLSISAGLTLDKFGSRILAIQSVLLVTFGWTSFRYALLNSPGNDSAAAICFVVTGMGGIAGFLSIVNSVESQFPPSQKGVIHGILLGLYVLSSAIWASVYYSIFQGYLINYATTMAIVSAVWGSIMAFSQVNHHVVIKRAAIAAKAAAAPAAPVTSVVVASSASAASSDGSPSAAAHKCEACEAGTPKPARDAPAEAWHAHHPSCRTAHVALYPVHANWSDPAFQEWQENEMEHAAKDSLFSIVTLRSLLSPYAWALYVIIFVTHGTARIFVNSCGVAIKAMRGPADPNPAATNEFVRNIVVIFSVVNAAARIVGGKIHDRLAQKGISRLQLFTPGTALVLIASYSLAFADISEASIIAGAVIMALGDGLCFVTWPVVCKETFSPTRYGKSFSLFQTAVGFGSLSLNAMASNFVHEHGRQNAKGSWLCYGSECFQNTWIIAGTLVAGLGFLLTIGLVHYTYSHAIIPSKPGYVPPHLRKEAPAASVAVPVKAIDESSVTTEKSSGDGTPNGSVASTMIPSSSNASLAPSSSTTAFLTSPTSEGSLASLAPSASMGTLPGSGTPLAI